MILAACLSGGSVAEAQGVGSWLFQEEAQAEQEETDEAAGDYTSLMVYGRISRLDRDVRKETIFSSGIKYTDLFGTGTGFMFEGSSMWEVYGVPSEGSISLGPYVSLGWDSYEGKRHTRDSGTSLEPDDMDIRTFLAGVRLAVHTDSGFFGGGYLGLGAAKYSSVDGVLTTAGIPGEVEVFKSSTVFALDVGARVGYRSGPFIADLGLGLRNQGAPKDGDIDLDSENPAEFAFEIGVGFNF